MSDTGSQCALSHAKVEQLRFDPENPRIPNQQREKHERDVLSWMLTNGDLLELMQSIASSGYSDAEPVLVVPDGDNNYTVVEGNRRLAALRLLNHPEMAPSRKKSVAEIAANATHKVTEIPVLIYQRRQDILDYLGYRHITGVKAWGAREKAEYLKQLYETHRDGEDPEKTIATISKMIGTRPYYAKRLLGTLSVIELAEEYGFWGSNEFTSYTTSNFSVIHTALSYENIRNYINLKEFLDGNADSIDHEKTRNLLEWVSGNNRKISESRELKKLNAVVGNERALGYFTKGATLSLAAEYTGEALDDFRMYMQKAHNNLQEADRLLSRIAQDLTKDDFEEVSDIAKLAQKILKLVES